MRPCWHLLGVHGSSPVSRFRGRNRSADKRWKCLSTLYEWLRRRPLELQLRFCRRLTVLHTANRAPNFFLIEWQYVVRRQEIIRLATFHFLDRRNVLRVIQDEGIQQCASKGLPCWPFFVADLPILRCCNYGLWRHFSIAEFVNRDSSITVSFYGNKALPALASNFSNGRLVFTP